MALSPEMKEGVYVAYGRKCLRCGATENLAVDHVIARCEGGTDDPANLQPLCKSCNSSKRELDTDYRTEILPVEPAETGYRMLQVRVPLELFERIRLEAYLKRTKMNPLALEALLRAFPPEPAPGPQPDRQTETRPASPQTTGPAREE